MDLYFDETTSHNVRSEQRNVEIWVLPDISLVCVSGRELTTRLELAEMQTEALCEESIRLNNRPTYQEEAQNGTVTILHYT